MTRSPRLATAGAAVPAAVLAVVLLGDLPDPLQRWAAGWGLVVAGAWSGALAWRRARSTGDRRWARVARTVGLWTLGQVLFAATDGGDGPAHVVSSVVFVLVGVSAVDVLLRSPDARRASRLVTALDAATAGLAVLGLLWDPVLVPAMSISGGAAAVSLPLIEVVVVAVGVSILVQSGGADRALVAVVAATSALLVGDIRWLHETGHGGYELGSAADVVWPVAVGIVAVLAVDRAPREDGAQRAWHQLLPILPIALLAAEGMRQLTDGGVTPPNFICGVSAFLVHSVRQRLLHQEVIVLGKAYAEERDRLAAAEERARLLLECSGDGIIGADRDGRIIFANRSAELLLGLEPGAATGLQGHDVAHRRRPDGSPYPREDCPLGPAVQAGATIAADLDWWSRADGSFVPVEYRAQPVVRAGQQWGSVVTFRDVSARIEATEALAAQERRWRSLIVHSSDVVVVVDAEFRVRFTTPSIARVLGYGRGEPLGQALARFVHADDLASVADDVRWLQRQPGGTVKTATHRYRHADGRWLWMEVTATNLLHDPDVAGIVCNLRDVTDRVAAQDLLRHQATHDALTTLPNRAALRQWVAARDGADASFGLVLLDLDGFKEVNDALGHTVGDELLCRIADRLRASVRAGDLVGRLGGDEFAAVVSTVDDAALAELAERLLAAVGQPVHVGGWNLTVTASAGGAVGHGEADLDGAFQRADIAMYRAKRARGGGTYAAYGSEDEQDRRLDLELTNDLRQAITDGELGLHYQVKVDGRSGRSAGVEALARWHHPVHGHVPPGTFVALAERAGLVGALTDLVLDRAIAQAARWRADGLEVPVAVNISPASLRDRCFAREVLRRLDQARLPAALLEVEITEAAVADPTEVVLDNLVRLREAGVRVAIDDFGTGYSSLSYLKELPVDTLKIDRSFVAGLDSDGADREIIQAICSLGTSLGLTIVGEGVETPAVAQRLVAAGCAIHQGYLYHRPEAPADVTAALLRRWEEAGTGVSS